MIQREIVYAKTTDSIVKQHLQSSSSSTYLNIQRRMAKTNHLSRCDAFATVNIVSWLGCDAPVHTFFYTSNPLTSRRTFFFCLPNISPAALKSSCTYTYIPFDIAHVTFGCFGFWSRCSTATCVLANDVINVLPRTKNSLVQKAAIVLDETFCSTRFEHVNSLADML